MSNSSAPQIRMTRPGAQADQEHDANEAMTVRKRGSTSRSKRHKLAGPANCLVAISAALAVVGSTSPRNLFSAGVVAAVALSLSLSHLTLPRYERDRSLKPAATLLGVAALSLVANAVFNILDQTQERTLVIAVAVAALASAAVAYTGARRPGRESVILVGDTEAIADILNEHDRRPHLDVRGLCLDGRDAEGVRSVADVPVFGGVDASAAIATQLGVDRVIAVPGRYVGSRKLRALCWKMEDADIEFSVVAHVTGTSKRRIAPHVRHGLFTLSVRPATSHPRSMLLKGAVDRTIGALLLLVAAIPMGILVLLVRRDSPGPGLFRQIRTGRDGKTFTMYKLRTMVVDAESRLDSLREMDEGAGLLFKMEADPRITRIGRRLRRSSLDELPQLLNVVKGEMSLIGPRPALPSETMQYDSWVDRRLKVKPGMTGPWQVSGRSSLGWDESILLDLDYVDNWSLRGDLIIAAKTARAVVTGDGAV